MKTAKFFNIMLEIWNVKDRAIYTDIEKDFCSYADTENEVIEEYLNYLKEKDKDLEIDYKLKRFHSKDDDSYYFVTKAIEVKY